MNQPGSIRIQKIVFLVSLLLGCWAVPVVSAGEPIQFSGPKSKIELPSGREVFVPSGGQLNFAPETRDSMLPERPTQSPGSQLSLRDQLRLKELIHEKQNWMFYDPHILSGKSLFEDKPGSLLAPVADPAMPPTGAASFLFGKPGDSKQPVIPLARPSAEFDFGMRKTDTQDSFSWPADRKPASGRKDFFGNTTAREANDGSARRSTDGAEASLFEILNPGGRSSGLATEQLSRQKAFEQLLSPPAPSALAPQPGITDPIRLSGDATRQTFSGVSTELPAASRLGSVLDPMQSFTAAGNALRGPSLSDPNARYHPAAAPASASRQVEAFRPMLKSPTISEFPTRKF